MALAAPRERLTRWLVESAYPLWAARGIDPDGGFVERLSEEGRPPADDRRARVAPRQIFAFALAGEFGWKGDAPGIVRRGLEALDAHYRRPDGLYRALVRSDGSPKDQRALLYDQAFVLLAFAAASRMLPAIPGAQTLERRALELLEAIENAFRTPQGTLRSQHLGSDLVESNPHMHLLEACLAWMAISRAPTWQSLANEIAELALRRFIHSDTGALTEAFMPDWRPVPGIGGQLVEPGHQFEWAWLLLCWNQHQSAHVSRAALRLIEVGERYGVREGFAVNTLRGDLSVHDADVRLWPQTERLRAGLLAARITGEEKYRSVAVGGAGALAAFLDTPIAGLWFDRRRADGRWLTEPAPASTLYHIVGAIYALAQPSTGPSATNSYAFTRI
jgi:mannose-6-phosphate isomerase